jgi:DNA-binding transcriptional regulator YiaG
MNITQEKLAQRLGVSFATVNRWENGKAKPSQLAQKQIEEMLKDLGPRGNDLLKEFFSNGL